MSERGGSGEYAHSGRDLTAPAAAALAVVLAVAFGPRAEALKPDGQPNPIDVSWAQTEAPTGIDWEPISAAPSAASSQPPGYASYNVLTIRDNDMRTPVMPNDKGLALAVFVKNEEGEVYNVHLYPHELRAVPDKDQAATYAIAIPYLPYKAGAAIMAGVYDRSGAPAYQYLPTAYTVLPASMAATVNGIDTAALVPKPPNY